MSHWGMSCWNVQEIILEEPKQKCRWGPVLWDGHSQYRTYYLMVRRIRNCFLYLYVCVLNVKMIGQDLHSGYVKSMEPQLWTFVCINLYVVRDSFQFEVVTDQICLSFVCLLCSTARTFKPILIQFYVHGRNSEHVSRIVYIFSITQNLVIRKNLKLRFSHIFCH